MSTLTRTLHGLIVAGLLAGVGATPTIDINYPTPTVDETVIADQLDTMTSGRDCTPEGEPRLVDHVIVNYPDTIVVRDLAFDKAYRLATEGKVKVLAYCSN